ncbi:MAG: type I DNA topoisomerase [bacterium]
MSKKTLIIVESPTKARTISHYLGKSYIIKASQGHIRDLPQSDFGIDITDGEVKVRYVIPKDKRPIIKELKEVKSKVDTILFATDPDREGEAISWHLADVLKVDPNGKCRIEFHEITKEAVTNSLKDPKPINISRVNAQQGRRVLDRIVGYRLSPFLWEKLMKKDLSAGRVQSVALRFICDREKEIEAFIPQEYWEIDGRFSQKDIVFSARLLNKGGGKVSIPNEIAAKDIVEELKDAEFKISKIKQAKKKRSPLPPFITSTLQQEASKRLGFSPGKTMFIAQQLYEGLKVEDTVVGLITYMRTDSVRVSQEAIEMAREYILNEYGKDYLPEKPRIYKSRKGAQEAHEAIRPTSVVRTPEKVSNYLNVDQSALYRLIWERFIASQMEDAIYSTISVDVIGNDYLFRSNSSRLIFSGYQLVSGREEEEGNFPLERLNPKEPVELLELIPSQHFTQPPPRYTEASLIKLLEERGIGRPSTYATIVETIVERNYVTVENHIIKPTETGMIVCDLLLEFFPNIMDPNFTAKMEEDLDKIEEDKKDWGKLVKEFYTSFEVQLKEATEKAGINNLLGNCPLCGKPLVEKRGRFGAFIGCSGYPECKYTRPITKPTGVKCPKCGGEIVGLRSKNGKIYYRCSNYPTCDFVIWNRPTNRRCPKCGYPIVLARSKKGNTYRKCSNPECDYVVLGRRVVKKDEK